MFRSLVASVKEVAVRRGVEDKGARVAARQTIYTVRAIADPPYATEVAAGTPLAAFFAAAEADPVTAAVAQALRAAVESRPLDWPAVYTQAAVMAGLTEAEAAAIGIGGLPAGEEPAAVVTMIIAGDVPVN